MIVVWKKMGNGGDIIVTVVCFDGKTVISSDSCWIHSWKVVDVGGELSLDTVFICYGLVFLMLIDIQKEEKY